ncbi:dentin sialophosphoprotein isoform X1 [Microplitis demolitor]|uniref:dentin sialophosphoprotein isoform X1 n=1 Tax=Microplitis demolitor TaxID=69319 RepID=UPI0004CDC7DC|nr:dentin sialophosphoprotein isoform X1 [Microplitis demolitor]
MHITHMKCHFHCKTGRMSSTSGNNSATSTTSYSGASTLTGGVGGALSLMGCVREASPPPQNHRTLDLGDLAMQRHADLLPKEPKKRRFHPLRGLRKIFRRKSRSAADATFDSHNDRNDPVTHDREDMTLRHPAGRTEDARSQSASELLTDSCDCQSGFLRRGGGVQQSFTKLRGASGQLSVSHDSVFPGEVPHTRPLSSLDTLATFQRRQGKTSEEVHKSHGIHGAPNNRISLRVLEQIKTAIESRNQLASAETHVPHASGEHYQQETTESRFSRTDKRERIDREEPEEKFRVTRTQTDNNDKIATLPKEELPELESDSLNHTAAHHRISVRPKNRRPPRRTMTSTTSSMSCSTITTISENSDVLDSLELSTVTSSNASTPVDPKGITIMRKSSSRMSSRTSDIFEEFDVKKKPSSMASLSPDSLDLSVARMIEQTDTQDSGDLKVVTIKSSNRMTKLSNVYDELETTPKKRTSVTRLSKSPDSLDNSFSKSSEGFDKLIENEEAPTFGRLQNLISKSTDGFDKLAEHGEIKPMPRRLTNMISKSTDGFETSPDRDDPRPARRPSNQIYKFSDTVSKSSDSLEAIQALVSDDSIERRRSSFEIRPRRNHKTMSMSSDNFGSLDHQQPELQKISSTSDVYLTRANKHHGKIASVMSKSTDNFEIMNNNQENSRSNLDFKYNYKSYKRTISSESSDNLELEDRVESRKTRKPPKKIPNSILGMYPDDHDKEDYDRRPSLLRKPPTPRLQKSSESSELGSTDTLDSEKRNKSSDSTETLDSLDKDLDQDTRDDDIANNVNDKYDKNDSWSTKTMENKQNTDNADGMEEDSKSLTYTDKPYWRQSSESKENIDIHQLLTIVSRITDNGNNQRNSVPFTKKLSASPPSSPVVKQEDNKMLFNNLLTTKNDEELQNMLNGNISEVSTDTKSFKEKLIMFEKLGK